MNHNRLIFIWYVIVSFFFGTCLGTLVLNTNFHYSSINYSERDSILTPSYYIPEYIDWVEDGNFIIDETF